ncbi:MAG: PorV/PorQ family protein [Candidatus Marinimicrobia bacterium]|nr:PorV/PorQ family protein [Candidatus Neomarinimicrobiota bacterium]
MMKTRLLISILLVFTSVILADGGSSGTEIVPKSGTSGSHFLLISPDAGFAGMGNAYAAYKNTSASSAFYNPATLVYLDNKDLFFGMVNWAADIQFTSAAYAMQMGNGRAIAFHYRALNTGKMNETTIFEPNGTGNTFAWKSLAVGVSTATQLTERFSFGVNLFYIKEGVAKYDMEASAWGVDLSTFYITGFNTLNMGMTIRNFGPELDFDKTFVDYANGDTATVDESYRPYHIPLQFQIGVNYEFFEDDSNQQLFVSVDGVHPNDALERLQIGMEYNYMNLLSIRGGLYSNHDSVSWMGGFGVNGKSFIQQDITFNYSVSNYGLLGFLHQFSIGYGL